MKVIEGEAVACQANQNREWTQINVNLDCGCRAALKRKDAGVGSRLALKGGYRQGGIWRDAKHSGRDDRAPKRLDFRTWLRLVSFGGWARNFRKSLIFNLDLRKSLIFKLGLTQVVDLHDIFRYFQCFSGHVWRNDAIPTGSHPRTDWEETEKAKPPKSKMHSKALAPGCRPGCRIDTALVGPHSFRRC